MSNNTVPFNQTGSNNGSGKTLLLIIILVVVSVVLYLVIRYGNSAIQDWRQRQLSHETADQQPNLGLKASDVNIFPTFIYRVTTENDYQKKSINQNGDCNGNRKECSICLSELEEEDVVRKLLPCRHFFHVECVDVWLYSHASCPLCREKLNAEKAASHEGPSMSPPLPHLHPFKRALSEEVERKIKICIDKQPETTSERDVCAQEEGESPSLRSVSHERLERLEIVISEDLSETRLEIEINQHKVDHILI